MSSLTLQELNSLVTVGMGDYKVTNGVNRLITRDLGSCVGIAVWDPVTSIGGLLHIMLPEYVHNGFDDTVHNGLVHCAKYADIGLDALMRTLAERGANRKRLMAKIAGGAHMLACIGNAESSDISTHNVQAVRKKLGELGIPILAEEVGGHHPRTLVFDTVTGELRILTARMEDRIL